MRPTPKRTIEEVLFDHYGPLTSNGLLSMPRDGWEHLRAEITDNRNGGSGLVARCFACGSAVFIRTVQRRPLFAHYQGSDPDCPWYTGRNMHPNSVRAAQYQGQQESEMHRRMCELIAELAALDERCVSAKVGQYLRSSENPNGRYPDVKVEWRDFGSFVVEYQMSHTFQTEVSQRSLHYERERIPLLWVLSSIGSTIVPQAVSDVVHRHRGNAFILDQEAVAASRAQRTLVLSCYLRNGEAFDRPVLVRFDALTFPESRLPYFEDRLIKPILDRIRDRRKPIFSALRAWDRHTDLPIDDLERFPDRHQIAFLVAAAFSVVVEAEGRPENFASSHPNLKAMLNTYQTTGKLAKYARLLYTLIEHTSQNSLLTGTVGEHLRRSINREWHYQVRQADEDSSEWNLLRELLPEALNPLIRQQLSSHDALPPWAKPRAPG